MFLKECDKNKILIANTISYMSKWAVYIELFDLRSELSVASFKKIFKNLYVSYLFDYVSLCLEKYKPN